MFCSENHTKLQNCKILKIQICNKCIVKGLFLLISMLSSDQVSEYNGIKITVGLMKKTGNLRLASTLEDCVSLKTVINYLNI